MMIKAMPEEWFVRVGDREYGPADLETLREWKLEGRILAANPLRRADSDVWTPAADVPGLFGELPSAAARAQGVRRPPEQHRTFIQLIAETLRIYGAGLLQFAGLALVTVSPSVCGQLAAAFIRPSGNVNADLSSLIAAGFGFCMLVLSMVLWPIYIAAIQITTAEFAAGRRLGLLQALNEAVRYWPRVAALCLFVYGVFFLLIAFGVTIAAIPLVAPNSLLAALFALGLLVLQIWLFGRFFINVLFWQQFAVLENAGVADALRLSKGLARSGQHSSWYRRPMWRGAFIASLWFGFAFAIAILQDWPIIVSYWNQLFTIQDPQVLLEKLTAAQQTRGFDVLRFALGLLQRLLQPLVGVAFVVLYLDSRTI
jgi:GYF domain 2